MPRLWRGLRQIETRITDFCFECVKIMPRLWRGLRHFLSCQSRKLPPKSKSCPAYEGDWDSHISTNFPPCFICQNHAPLMKGIETRFPSLSSTHTLEVKIMPRLWRGLRQWYLSFYSKYHYTRQNHAPLMKGIETLKVKFFRFVIIRSKSCPAYEGDWDMLISKCSIFLDIVKIMPRLWRGLRQLARGLFTRKGICQNHAPLMKGIETHLQPKKKKKKKSKSCPAYEGDWDKALVVLSGCFPGSQNHAPLMKGIETIHCYYSGCSGFCVKIMPRLWRGLRQGNTIALLRFHRAVKIMPRLWRGLRQGRTTLFFCSRFCQNHAPLMKGINCLNHDSHD